MRQCLLVGIKGQQRFTSRLLGHLDTEKGYREVSTTGEANEIYMLLFRSQRQARIHARGLPGWNKAREQRHHGQEQRYSRERQRIRRRHAP
jgi:hypothetical protein